MASPQGVSNSGQLQQQPAVFVRQQNTPAPAEASVNGKPNTEKSGNALPPAADSADFTEQPTGEQLQEAVAKLSDFVQTIQRDLSFSVDDTSGKTIITVTDSKTDEVVRQIPSESMVKLAQNLKELQEALGNSDSSKGNLLEIRV